MASANSIIPSPLVGLAEQKGACEEAIAWLREKPRTFRDLADHVLWMDWAAKNLLSAPAEKAYDEAVATAEKAYKEAVAPAWKAYKEAVAPAEKAYDEAVAPAWKAYKEAVAPAWKAYKEAVAPAEKAYKEAVATAWKAYKEAVATALAEALEKELPECFVKG